MEFKTASALLISFAATGVFAGTMGSQCEKELVAAPCTSGWEFAGQALYLQPSVASGAFATERTATNAVTGLTQTYGIIPQYGWGFFLEGSRILEHGNDLNLNFYYFDNTTSQTQALALGGVHRHSISISWAAANFEIGKQLHAGEINGIRVHGGVQYARLHYLAPSFFNNIAAATPIGGLTVGTSGGRDEKGFNGFGPRIGVDLDYKLTQMHTWLDGFKVYANGATGLLAGTNTSKFSITRTTALTGTGSVAQTSSQVVPELDAKLGLNYMHTLAAAGQFSADVGWLWVEYLGGLDIQGPNAVKGNVSFQGLFFGLRWMGDVAV